MGEAARTVLEFETEVALARSPANGGGVARHYGTDCRGSIAGDATRQGGSGGGSPALALPVGAADGAHTEVVIHAANQSVDNIGAEGGSDVGSSA